jgi:hypothetical protein
MPKPLPSPELLRKLLRYDPETGMLFWRERPSEMFPDTRSFGAWNTRQSGNEAFTSHNGAGYLRGTIFNQHLRAHRVIWAMYHGAWPRGEIDHINGIRDDNRVNNLRDVTSSENGKNSALRSDNYSGAIGVSWNSTTKKWEPTIGVNGRSKYLGRFKCKSDAIAARKKAEIKYGYHPNHGRTSRQPTSIVAIKD